MNCGVSATQISLHISQRTGNQFGGVGESGAGGLQKTESNTEMEQSKYCMFGILLALLHWQARKSVKLEQDLKYKKFNIVGPPFRWNGTHNSKYQAQ